MIVEDETNFEDGYRTVVVENSKKKRRKLNIPVGEGNKDQLVQLAGIDLVKIGRRFKM